MAKRTFKDRMTIGKGADQIDLYYFGRGHTNGDAWIVFPAHRIVHRGDIFARKNVPLIDGNNGGSMLELPETLRKAHAGITNIDQIINGHTPAQTTWADLKEFVQFNADVVAYGRAGLKAGKTPEQLATEWKLPEKYKGYSRRSARIWAAWPDASSCCRRNCNSWLRSSCGGSLFRKRLQNGRRRLASGRAGGIEHHRQHRVIPNDAHGVDDTLFAERSTRAR